MNVICFGDSNTFGYDPRSWYGGRYEPEYRWVDILAAETLWDVVNAGVNGREIPRNGISVPEDTDLLIVMLGTNDLLQGCSVDAASDRMETFLKSLQISRDKILLIAPPPMCLGEWVTGQGMIEASICLAESLRSLAMKFGIRFADASLWHIPMAFDGVHFTEEGHKIFAESLTKYLKLLLKTQEATGG